MQGKATDSNGQKRIFHVSSRLNIMGLRDEILRMHGFEVDSAVYSSQAADEVASKDYDLVLIDVEADVRVQSAQELCDADQEGPPAPACCVCLQLPRGHRQRLSRRNYPRGILLPRHWYAA